MVEGSGDAEKIEQVVQEVAESAAPQKWVITIEFDTSARNVKVTGPSDLVLALGMLEMAKHTIIKASQSGVGPRVMPAGMIPPDLLRRR